MTSYAYQTAEAGVRTFSTGATRDTDEGKFEFGGFLSHEVLEAFAHYMHGKRKLPDGTMRSASNWKRGIPRDAYMSSMHRHFMAVWKSHDTEGAADIEELCALLFNVQGMLYELLKGR